MFFRRKRMIEEEKVDIFFRLKNMFLLLFGVIMLLMAMVSYSLGVERLGEAVNIITPTLAVLGLLSIVSYLVKDRFELKGPKEIISASYITNLSLKEMIDYMSDIMIIVLEKAMVEDIDISSRMDSTTINQKIYENGLVRFLNYFNEEMPFIMATYGKEFLGKQYDLMFFKLRKTGVIEGLIRQNTVN